ncbi:hypothetical protein K437DRAFT_254223 [Tilletiaria anomala UBC 951]|uniref:HD domain-containing protein n=1 Tax=Tilletiaria anomala (strain ATCC 24038 / CBS 436.72 / UBC 951) TaxID=1037660 RepID=A0A066WP99_TILAU|nr:uncharacterized protein K437DRAFT_254223 [Tilletiaria anomala UBC 951]KDN52445.1 hypothetical protein K437DRAFT_254223 [Tilletiaria anomala UBC 951]
MANGRGSIGTVVTANTTAGSLRLTHSDAEAHVDWLFTLLESQGHADYIGEPISQLEHCLQAAHFAEQAGANATTVIAALLHDVGQFIPLEEKVNSAKFAHAQKDGQEMMQGGASVGRMGHDRLGEEWLRQHGWPETVSKLVGAHVVAKRYLTATSAEYLAALSFASVASLKHQGGPFTSSEVTAFEQDPQWRQKVQLRLWDDKAKVVGLETKPISAYRKTAVDVLLGVA